MSYFSFIPRPASPNDSCRVVENRNEIQTLAQEKKAASNSTTPLTPLTSEKQVFDAKRPWPSVIELPKISGQS